ncbi:hypothetical protein LTR37_005878 [Vermiconidia calcicola]|uniref:Uncharacterized protein n=1 Tax=Vermiconidia calcicola TaxID=1690605 RepID=A0ACC3NK14_9PEZI|nr:hypothetical protein LTR37_005878 [Vermiconidia calcicola]
MLAGAFSDRLTWRMPFICVPLVIVVIAYAILFSQSADIANNIPQCYFALCLACAGLYPVTPGVSAWNINNITGPTARAQGAAYMNALGAIGGIIGSYMYLDSESPSYPTGYGLSFALAALGIASALVMEFIFKKKNRKRDQMTETEIYEKYTEEQLGKMGHRSPFFRFTL